MKKLFFVLIMALFLVPGISAHYNYEELNENITFEDSAYPYEINETHPLFNCTITGPEEVAPMAVTNRTYLSVQYNLTIATKEVNQDE